MKYSCKQYSINIVPLICMPEAKRDFCTQIYSMHRSLFYEAGLRELLLDLHTLVCVFLGVIANNGKFEVPTLESEITDNIENNLYYRQTTKEQDRLHRVETHKAILLLRQEEDEARHPAQDIAQACFNVG